MHGNAQQKETTNSKRRSLRSSETRALLQDFKRKFPGFAADLQSKTAVEEIPVDDEKLFLVGDKPVVISVNGELFPALMNEEVLRTLPSIVVDMGAIPHICNGADIMRPGIKQTQGEFERGAVLVVKDIKFGKPIGICVAETSSESMRAMSKGKAARNVHYVGDRFWEAMKKS